MIDAPGGYHTHGGVVSALPADAAAVSPTMATQPLGVQQLFALPDPLVATRWPKRARSEGVMTTHPGPLRTTCPFISNGGSR